MIWSPSVARELARRLLAALLQDDGDTPPIGLDTLVKGLRKLLAEDTCFDTRVAFWKALDGLGISQADVQRAL